MVLKKDFTRKKRKGGKLDYRWQGPYVILASVGKGLYKLKELNGDKVGGSLNIYSASSIISIFLKYRL